MSDSGTERVWILGAGFSRSLGGPLLTDLLSMGEYLQMQARFPSVADKFSDVMRIFQWGIQGAGRGTPGLWPNAETFLEFVDGAEPGSAAANLLGGTMPGGKLDLAELRRRARQMITASCWGFVRDKPREQFVEAWMPYSCWFSSLDTPDVIVTFNYDLVIERATSGGLVVVKTSSGWSPSRHIVRLLKLHGSVNWKTLPPNVTEHYKIEDLTDQEILVGPHDSLIAAPGRSKESIAESLGFLWRCALDAIREAREVYMIGYSMPASDNGSKKRILDALAENVHASNREHGLDIHLVLGNDRVAANRLRRILELNAYRSGQHYRIQEYPVNAEDFLLVYGR